MDKLIEAGVKVSAIIGDLPYGTTACSWDEIIPFAPMWERVKKINKGVFVTTASQPFTSKIVMSNIKKFRYEWIWEKNNGTGGMNANKMPLKIHENILTFYDHLPVYNPQFSKGNPYKIKRDKPKEKSVYGKTGTKDNFISENKGVRFPTTILYFDTQNETDHPTEKPVALYEYLIRTYTNEGDTVLDFTCGSGTTGVACVNTNRNCILIDKDQHWIDVATKRVKDAQQQMRLF